jgi:GH18 family chitinase
LGFSFYTKERKNEQNQGWGLIVACAALFLPSSASAESSNRVVVYYTNWAQYWPGECRFTPENVKAEYLTHLNYLLESPDYS